MPRALTNAQYNFVRELLAGKTREAAYASAYPKSTKWTRAVRDSTASKLLRTENVWEYYTSERQKLEANLTDEARLEGIWTRKRSMEAVAFVVGMAIQDAKANKRKRDMDPDASDPIITASIANAVIKGVCELNRMLECDASTTTMPNIEPIRIIDDYREDD